MISAAQIKLIRVAASECKLSEDEYKSLLSGYGIQHARDLMPSQAQEIMKFFTSKLGFEYKQKTGTNVPKKRPVEYATQAQLDLLAILWADNSRAKDRDSLNKFCKRICKIDRVEWLSKYHVSKLVKAIKNLSKGGQDLAPLQWEEGKDKRDK